jgi:formylglycine-generating enzyme required for sulfatase activity
MGAWDSYEVRLEAFELDETEVTVGYYRECVKAGHCAEPHTTVDWGLAGESARAFWRQFCNYARPNREAHPVNCVDWYQAGAYCNWAGKRLPTEAEWEYAARGSHGLRYPWGNSPPTAERMNACGHECMPLLVARGTFPDDAMYEASDAYVDTAPVGMYPGGRSPFGAYDMAGNVDEWTSTRFCRNPKVPCFDEPRVVKGGSWPDGSKSGVWMGERRNNLPGSRGSSLGFRCAR